MKCNNPSFGELLFSFLGYWFGERSLEVHQIRPVYLKLVWIDDTPAFHSSIPIYYFGCAYKYLLGITTTKSACSAKRPRINYCNTPSCRMTFPSHCRCCYSCPYYYKIKGLCIRHKHQYNMIINNKSDITLLPSIKIYDIILVLGYKKQQEGQAMNRGIFGILHVKLA